MSWKNKGFSIFLVFAFILSWSSFVFAEPTNEELSSQIAQLRIDIAQNNQDTTAGLGAMNSKIDSIIGSTANDQLKNAILANFNEGFAQMDNRISQLTNPIPNFIANVVAVLLGFALCMIVKTNNKAEMELV